MNTFRTLKTLGFAVAFAAILAGCAHDVKLDEAPVESRVAVPPSSTAGNTSGAGTGGISTVTLDPSEDFRNAASLARRTVYFDFDSYIVKDQYRPIVELNAKSLAADRTKHVTVEGHTDSRGGREYNLALGQKRAEAVSKSLSLLGVTGNQIEAVSFGSERPAVQGDDDEAAAKNRRAEIAYR